ncbi:MAG: tetratricopeptide repeat protein, partial [Gammaproteobacteria bacterium]|nr:tetratricopeptide repeat protein [Gammaproteobacteria bacterium]
RQRLGNQFAPDMADGLARAYGNRGNALQMIGDTQGALAAYDQAIALGEDLRQRLGNQFAPDMADGLARAYTSRGVALQMIGDTQGALAAYDVAVALWEDLRKKSGGESRKEYAQMLEQIKIIRTQILTNTDAKN